MKPIEQAIEFFGTQKKLADACGVSQAAVSKWLKGGNLKPKPEHAIKIETATGGKVKKEQILPKFPWTDLAA